MVVKPSKLTSLSAIRLAELAREAGLPDGVLNVVPGPGGTAGAALGRHMDVDKVTFTGSTEVGRLFLTTARRATSRRSPSSAAASRPQLVLAEPPDLDVVAEQVLFAALMNMGENCSCGSRLLVHAPSRSRWSSASSPSSRPGRSAIRWTRRRRSGR